jgi:23S rRNA (cytidine2498-2'-O)-methyltransferase
VYLSAAGDDEGLIAELARGGVSARVLRPGVVGSEEEPRQVAALARQVLPHAEAVGAPSITAWARLLVDRVVALSGPWRLHVFACYGVAQREKIGARAWHTVERKGLREQKRVASTVQQATISSGAGEHRCRLIEAAVRERLKERRRASLRALVEGNQPFQEGESLVQLVLVSAEEGWLSVVTDVYTWRRGISTFPGGEVEVAPDTAPPSRAFAKLVEAERRLGRTIAPGESVVDLGASPGGWTWVALAHGARVTSVDRAPLREDLMRRVEFVKGDALKFRPPAPVDWLVCDVITEPQRAVDLLLDWLRRGDTRWFIVTLKLRGDDHAVLDVLKRELPALAEEWWLTHLCANKGEACAYGWARRRS